MPQSPITRVELYELVWTTPMCHLAKAFGVSTYRLSQICDESEIPRPGGDYWPLLRLNRVLEKDPLPLPPVGFIDPISIEPKLRLNKVVSGSKEKGDTDQPTLELTPEKGVLESFVATDFRKAHPLVRSAKAILENGHTSREGRLKPPYNTKCLAVRVTKEHLRRGLLLMDAIIRQLQGRGLITRLGDDERGQTIVRVGEEDVSIFLMEKVEQRKRELTPEEKKWSYVYDRYTYHPTGLFQFRIDEYTPKSKKNWSEGKHQRIELMIEEIVEGIVTVGEQLRILRLEREEQHRRWEEEARLREMEENRRKAEQAKIEELWRQSQNWRKAEDLQSFVRACRESLGQRAGDNLESQQWLQWAERLVEINHPIRNGWLDRTVTKIE